MRLTLLPLLVLAVVATACGGSDDGPIVVQTTTTGMFVTTTAAPSDYSPATTTTPNVATTLVAVATTVVPATTTVALVDVPESVTVEKGDSLSKIAKRYGTTVDALVRINGLCDANQIFVGQVVVLEDPESVADADAAGDRIETAIVTVQPGDSLSKIAKRHDTTVEELMALNDIDDPNLLFVGQELLVDEVVSATEGPEENPNC
ncbi:MAG: LysM domain-containing protein [Actinomycetota bacterium]|jgi:LysM repeat protein|nr:LysM domain-containing protein [Actinomycetota bacterium]